VLVHIQLLSVYVAIIIILLFNRIIEYISFVKASVELS
jgi:hypothetical protein